MLEGREEYEENEKIETILPWDSRLAFVYLVSLDRMDFFFHSLKLLYKNFNRKHRHRVILLFVMAEFKGGDAQIEETLKTIYAQAPEIQQDLEILYTPFIFPEGVSEKDVGTFWPNCTTFLYYHFLFVVCGNTNSLLLKAYKHMIRFWFKVVFTHPRIAELDYFVRMDTDSYFCKPIPDYLFSEKFLMKLDDQGQATRDARFKYLWNTRMLDDLEVTVGLWDFLDSYVEKHSDIRRILF